MKRFIDIIKKKDDAIVIALIFFVIIGICLNIRIEASDEIWNFQNAYKMHNGFKIYRDVNIIVTPLFFLIVKFIFGIFGANLFVFRIIHCFIIISMYFFTYKIYKELKIPKTISLLAILTMIFSFNFFMIRTCANYNNMALMFIVIGIYSLIKTKNLKTRLIGQAIISILIFLTKQNIGIYYIIGNIIYLILLDITKTEKIKKISKYLSLVIVELVIFILYMMIDNNLYNFINYTFGSLTEFADKNLKFNSSSVIFFIFTIVINIGISIFLIKNKYITKDQKSNIKVLATFSVPLLLIAYPIFNNAHILYATYISVINLVYILFLLFKDFFKGKVIKYMKTVNYIFIILLLIYSIYNIYDWICMIEDEEYPYLYGEPFFGGKISEEEYNENEKIMSYIKNNDKNVIILSYRAAIYMVPLEKNNGDFALPLKGNLGNRGEKGLIEKIGNMEDTLFLISIDSFDQETENAKEYIKSTKEYKGKIEDFDIYE